MNDRFIRNTRKKDGKEDVGSSKPLNPRQTESKKGMFHLGVYREQVLERNRKIEMNNNIELGQKSKNWDLIKQKITTAKVLIFDVWHLH